MCNRNIVIVEFGQIAARILDERTIFIAFEDALVGEFVANPDELIQLNTNSLEHVFKRFAEIAPRKLAVMQPDDVNCILTGDPVTPNLKAGLIGCPCKTELQELEVVVNAVKIIVEIFIVEHRAFGRLGVNLHAVRLRHKCVGYTVPRQIVAKENTGNPYPRQILVGWIVVVE